MRKGKLCRPLIRWKPWYTLFPNKVEPDVDYTDEGVTGFPTRKVTCPNCKRRVYADVRALHDGDIYWRVPPHKPRSWWKPRRKKWRKKR